MVGDGLNSPRVQGGKKPISADEKQLPDKYMMRNTRVLNMCKAQLKELSEEIVQTACEEQVNVVNLEDNLLSDVPAELKQMSDLLTDLGLAKNQLCYIPTFISQFSRLLAMNLSCNMLRDLPMEFAGLQSLRELNISHNRLDRLPPCLFELDALEKLIAHDNQIRELDASENGLGALRYLNSLDLSNNNIQMVPPVLGNLTNITDLKLSGNPFRQPRHQILAQGTAAVMDYLRGRIPL